MKIIFEIDTETEDGYEQKVRNILSADLMYGAITTFSLRRKFKHRDLTTEQVALLEEASDAYMETFQDFFD